MTERWSVTTEVRYCDVCDTRIKDDDYHTQDLEYHFHEECCPVCDHPALEAWIDGELGEDEFDAMVPDIINAARAKRGLDEL